MSSSHAPPGRIALRAPPHLPFIQGYPGIPASANRRQAAIHGTVEIRVGAQPIKAKWVRVEIRKYETIPPGFPSSSSSSGGGNGDGRSSWEHIGEINTLWTPNPKLNKEFDTLETADFKFYIPLPETMPPSVEMFKGSGVRYELVAACCYKQKGGMFKKESSAVMKIVEPLVIVKHELHSAWPLYNIPDSFTVPGGNGALELTVQRPYSAFGPGDRLLLTAVLHSNRPKPFKVKGFDCTLFEVVTVTEATPPADKRKSKKPPQQPTTKSRVIATTRYPIDESIGRGGEKSARLDMAIPADRVLVTARNARSLEVSYEVEVKAVCDGVPETVLRGIKYIVGPYTRPQAQQAIRDIGNFPPLCPGVGGPHSSNPPSTRAESPPLIRSPSLTSSPPPNTYSPNPHINNRLSPMPSPSPQFGVVDYPPGFSGHPLARPPVQGFQPQPRKADDPRRISSSTMTTMTTMTTAHDFAPQTTQSSAGQRAYSTVPSSSAQNRQSMPATAAPIPSPQAQGDLVRSPSYGSSIHHPTTSPLLDSGARFGSNSGSAFVPQQYAVSDLGHGNGNDEWRTKRFSTATNMTFGPMGGKRDVLEMLAEQDPARTDSPAPSNFTTNAQPPSFPDDPPASSSSGIPTNAQPVNWHTAESEKQRLYQEARNRAAVSQLQSGASMAEIGMDAPPDYYPAPAAADFVPASTSGSSRGPSNAPVIQHQDAGPTLIPTTPEIGIDNEEAGSSSAMPNPHDRVSGHGMGSGGYGSAADEKTQQRKRYEEAQLRSSGAAGPSSLSSSAIPAVTVSPHDGPRPKFGSGPSSFSSPSGPTFLSAEEEKAIQRRRYEAATGQVQQTQSGSNSTSAATVNPDPPPFDQGTGTGASKPSGMPWTYLSAEEEKELQRKRFEVARLKVDSGSGGGGGFSRSGAVSPAFSDTTIGTTATTAAPYMDAPLTSKTGPSPLKASGPSARATPAPTGGTGGAVSALDEKTQMKRYYEALDRVAKTQSGASGSGSGGASAGGSGGAIGTSPHLGTLPAMSPAATSANLNPSSSSAGAIPQRNPAIMSAAQEKEQMKRYYEAVDKVERSQGSVSGHGGGGSGSGSGSGSHLLNGTAGTPALARSTPPRNTGNPSGPSTTSTPLSKPVVGLGLTAAQEKEQMKRYYEAVDRVDRAQSGSGGLSGVGPSSQPEADTLPGSGQSGMMSPISYDDSPQTPPPSGFPEHPITTFGTSKTTTPGKTGNTNPFIGLGPGSSSKSPAINSPVAFMSAADEKEQIRKRFEDAQMAVQSRSGRGRVSSPGPGPGPSPNLETVTSFSSLPTGGTGSARQSSGSAALESSLPDIPTVTKPGPTRKLTHISDPISVPAGAPPPPLPARPPADYIHLLRPAGEGKGGASDSGS